jgi:hypothetical protein
MAFAENANGEWLVLVPICAVWPHAHFTGSPRFLRRCLKWLLSGGSIRSDRCKLLSNRQLLARKEATIPASRQTFRGRVRMGNAARAILPCRSRVSWRRFDGRYAGRSFADYRAAVIEF